METERRGEGGRQMIIQATVFRIKKMIKTEYGYDQARGIPLVALAQPRETLKHHQSM